jgi:uncharacterized protein YraI
MICHGTVVSCWRFDDKEELAMKLKLLFAAALLLAPTAALAAPGLVSVSVGMRAGPGPGFPTVDRIPAGSHVNIHGCLRGGAWCDVSWQDDRGWISSRYLEYLYRNHYVYLPDYVDEVDVVPFVLSSYWSSYYAGRPWYHRRAYWNGYWQSHARFATQIPADRSARFGTIDTRTAVTGARTRAAVAPPELVRRRGFADVGGDRISQGRNQFTQGRMAHVNGVNPSFSRMPAHVAQPNIGRAAGSPMNAHAQMGAPRAAPAMPHMGMGGGGPAHINAAPRIGGGPPAGGPPGPQRH